MLSVHGTYDGKRLQLKASLNIQSPKKVIVIFLEEEDDNLTSTEMHLMAEQGGAFDFLKEEEDLYSDDDLKIRY